MAIQLPFGKKDGALTHISEVDSGLQCDCLCPSCEAPLIARKGKKTAHHFAHYQTKSCTHAVETALHWAAKNLLAEEGRIQLPPTQVHFNTFREPFELCKSACFSFDDVRLEQTLDNTIPDLVIDKEGRQLAIEIRVTHEVEEEKTAHLSNKGISILEIDLSDESRLLSMTDLRERVVTGIDSKEWIYNHRASRYRDRLIQSARRKMILETGMDMHVNECPAQYREEEGEYYALVIDDCWHCRHCVHHNREEGVIFCNG